MSLSDLNFSGLIQVFCLWFLFHTVFLAQPSVIQAQCVAFDPFCMMESVSVVGMTGLGAVTVVSAFVELVEFFAQSK